jgi:excisionase family DNA binding protein
MKNNYLHVQDICEHFGISKSTVYLYVRNNDIPHIRIGGKLYFTESDLAAWINSNKKLPANSKPSKA